LRARRDALRITAASKIVLVCDAKQICILTFLLNTTLLLNNALLQIAISPHLAFKMTDWSKLKVADLRTELKNRGLPQTGVKALLVERLVAAENGNGSESDATLQGDASKIDGDSATSPDDVSPILPTASDLLPNSNTQTTVEAEEPSDTQTAAEDSAPQTAEQRGLEAPSNESQPPYTSQLESNVETPNESQPTHTIESSQPAPDDFHHSALPSVEPREANEDRQKRKRRSQSPPPSASDAAHKRLRVDDNENTMAGVVTPVSDTEWVEKHNGVDAAEVNAEAKEIAPADEGVESGPTIVDTSMADVTAEEVPHEAKGNTARRVKGEAMEIDIPTPTKEEDKSAVYDESPSRLRDSRFKTLFSGDGPKPRSRDANEETEPDRIIGPAIHPATSGLYISHLMRPINPAQFQAHLAVLAAPPDSEADPDSIVKFYVDPIRTHAFVSFTTVAAAARVRSALHDRIWPDEKTRKPLWVDFVPADKVVEWIDQEQKSNPGGRSMAKKWEVYYDVDEDRLVTAILQEANTNVFARPMHPTRQPSIPISRAPAPVEPKNFDAPSGPRSFQPVPPTTNRLNELFKSTTAKPVLYWQPVPRELADRRLDNIDRSLSKDAAAGRRIDGASHRYSFQDEDVLVDRGPEIFSGIRRPDGQRGPRRGGGYQGRGGYGGGDSFRPNGNRRGDGYRGGNRRDDYGRR
jgi:hypothetical protein